MSTSDVDGTSTPDESILKQIITLSGGCSIVSIQSAKSAQQEVWILELQSDFSSSSSFSNETSIWKDCLRCGSNRIVLRIWKGGCQWWNLNRNHCCDSVADSEMMGYHLARESFQTHDIGNNDVHGIHSTSTGNIIIPRLLFWSSKAKRRTEGDDDAEIKAKTYRPWAVVEYVGPESRYFHKNGSTTNENNFDSTILEGMVKVRHEFGYDEPHPRWGRVPADLALEYSLMMIDQVIVPLHNQSRRLLLMADKNGYENNVTTSSTSNSSNFKNYKGMVELYREAWKNMMTVMEDESYELNLQNDVRMMKAFGLLKVAIEQVLPRNQSLVEQNDVLPVLVHLDLQPQNVLFACHGDADDYDDSSRKCSSSTSCNVRSVLDWEDAAIADPRFELLLLGRKVCANRDQAETIWKYYANAMAALTNDTKTSTATFELGSLLPWLQLETIHSITTLLLQSMDLLEGGRNPWENQTDLWDKLQREFQRWERLCSEKEIN